ncbi:MAG: CHAT domain-containing tetratricopeptide repeat protein [Myxococcota bacterium]
MFGFVGPLMFGVAGASPERILDKEQSKVVVAYRRSPTAVTKQAVLDAATAARSTCESAMNVPTASTDSCKAAWELSQVVWSETDPARLTDLDQLGTAHYVRGEYAEAEVLFRQGLAICEGEPGCEPVKTAEMLNSVGIVVTSQGRYDEAEPLYEEALEIGARELEPDDPSMVEWTNSLGHLKLQQGQYAEAITVLRRAVRLGEQRFGPDSERIGGLLNNLSIALSRTGKFPEAIEANQRSIAIIEATQGSEALPLATLMSNLAILYVRNEQSDEADRLYRRAIAISESGYGPDHPVTATHMTNHGVLLSMLARYDEAEPKLRRALAIRESALGSDHPSVADSLGSLAEMLRTRGDLREAEALTRRALSIAKSQLGTAHSNVGLLTNNLGALLHDLGEFAASESAYREALDIWMDVYGADDYRTARPLSNLALALADSGHAKEAVERLHDALEITETVFGPDHRDVGLRLANIAAVLAETEDYETSVPYFERAKGIFEATYGPDHPEIGTLLSNFALVREKQGRLDEALDMHRRALDITLTAKGPADRATAIRRNNLSIALAEAGNQREALQEITKAIRSLERRYGPDYPYLAQFMDSKAILLVNRGRARPSQRWVEQALKVEEASLHTNLFSGTQRQRWSRLQGSTRRVDLAVQFGVDGGKRDAVWAFETVLRRKARTLDAQHDMLELVRRRADPEGLELIGELLRNTRALTSRLTADPNGDPESLEALRRRIESLERELATQSFQFQGANALPTAEAVAATLPPNSALVEYVTYVRRTPEKPAIPSMAAFVVYPDATVVAHDLGSVRTLEAASDELREAIEDRKQLTPFITPLSRQAVAPLQLLDLDRVFIAPDGPLSLVPFELLFGEGPAPLVSYHTTGRDRLGAPSTGDANAPLVVYDVAYGEPSSTRVAWSALPGTRSEGAAVTQVLTDAQQLVGARATEAAVLAVERPGVVHIASHGFFSQGRTRSPADSPERGLDVIGDDAPAVKSRPMASLSGLVLAGANQPAQDLDDGILTAAEVANWDLRGTRLVTLSACQTGVGDVQARDGVHGLRRSLQLAGARSYVLSLWSVDDQATATLMAALYEALKRGQPVAEALADAKRTVRGESKWAHPFFWAGFTAAGDAMVRL